MDQNTLETYMRLAMEEVGKAIEEHNSPYGAVLIDASGNVIATAHNTTRSSCDPTAHAEINLLRTAATQLQQIAFDGYAVVTNAESCSMCMSACIKAHIYTFYHGAPNGTAGMNMDPAIPASEVARLSKHPVTIHSNILATECVEQIIRGKKNLV